jgi:hypothetical protein
VVGVVRMDEVMGEAGEIGREIGRRASLLMASATLSRLTTLTGAWSGWSGGRGDERTVRGCISPTEV